MNELAEIEQLLDASFNKEDRDKGQGAAAEEDLQKKSIMKKPGTPVPSVLGKRSRAQTMQALINSCGTE